MLTAAEEVLPDVELLLLADELLDDELLELPDELLPVLSDDELLPELLDEELLELLSEDPDDFECLPGPLPLWPPGP